jgi:hypothetical protein
MKTNKNAASLVAIAGLLFAGSAVAQVSADGLGKVIPVELFACTFNDGQDASDFDKVTERWNKFMDDNAIDNYAAWILQKYHYTPKQEFDFLWMGVYSDGNAMGAGTDIWLSKGGELQEDFDEVATCGAHIMFSSAMYKATTGDGTTTSGIISMMDCKLNKGHRYSDIKAAELKWAEYLAGAGSNGGYFHWFPSFGGGDAEFDYKVVFAYPNYTELGADFERFANGGGRKESREIFGDIDECDDPRVYIAELQRAAKIR